VKRFKCCNTYARFTGRALGFPDTEDGLPTSTVTNVLENTWKLHAKVDSTHVPSMLLDAERGKPIEVEVILGEVVRMAKERNVDIPVRIITEVVSVSGFADFRHSAHRNFVCSAPCCAEPNSAQDRNRKALERGEENHRIFQFVASFRSVVNQIAILIRTHCMGPVLGL